MERETIGVRQLRNRGGGEQSGRMEKGEKDAEKREEGRRSEGRDGGKERRREEG